MAVSYLVFAYLNRRAELDLGVIVRRTSSVASLSAAEWRYVDYGIFLADQQHHQANVPIVLYCFSAKLALHKLH